VRRREEGRIPTVGGLLVSQLLTLYSTPVIFLYLDRLRLWFRRRRKKSFPERTTAAAPDQQG